MSVEVAVGQVPNRVPQVPHLHQVDYRFAEGLAGPLHLLDGGVVAGPADVDLGREEEFVLDLEVAHGLADERLGALVRG